MNSSNAAIITSINPYDSLGIMQLIDWAHMQNVQLIIVGDRKTPLYPSSLSDDSHVNFVSIDEQNDSYPQLSRSLPENHYARKNIGYVIAHQLNKDVILDTDDDNLPLLDVFDIKIQSLRAIQDDGTWLNVYRLFGLKHLWPRGLPLEAAYREVDEAQLVWNVGNLPLSQLMTSNDLNEPRVGCFQSLVDGDPDIDAIGRMLFPGNHVFSNDIPVILDFDQVCPTNSQATLWRKELFPLLYLPVTASFRMTDIWRGIIGQVFMKRMGYTTVFGKLKIIQSRNEHSLLDDFRSEIDGHLFTREIHSIAQEVLLDIEIASVNDLKDALTRVYERLVKEKYLYSQELVSLQNYLAFF